MIFIILPTIALFLKQLEAELCFMYVRDVFMHCVNRVAEHAVKAHMKRAKAQLELDDIKKDHWDQLASLSHDEVLHTGCLYEAHGPLRMNETIHGDLMNVTLLGKSAYAHTCTLLHIIYTIYIILLSIVCAMRHLYCSIYSITFNVLRSIW
jgi:hypothetical protein